MIKDKQKLADSINDVISRERFRTDASIDTYNVSVYRMGDGLVRCDIKSPKQPTKKGKEHVK